MATTEQIDQLRRMIDDRNTPYTYSDDELNDRLLGYSLETVASVIWGEKAAGYADMVNMTEAGSSRSLSDLHKNALAMSSHYARLSSEEDEVDPSGFTTVRRITRL